MKKFLLSMAMVLSMAIGVCAQTVIETSTLTKDGDNATASKDGFTVLIEKKNASNAPALRNDGSVRVYAKGTVTVSGSNMTKIVFTLAADAAFRYTSFDPSTGALNPAQAEGDTEITWEGDATSVTFTVGDKAIYGTDGAEAAGQIRLSQITIYGEGGEIVEPTPDPDPTPGDYTEILATQLTTLPGVTNVSGFNVDIQKNNGSSAPVLRNDGSLRVYAKGTVTVSGSSMTKIVFTLAADAAFRYTSFDPSTGALNPAQAEGDTEITWEGNATSVTFTVGDKAIYGTDGAEAAGQIRFTKITIYGEGGEVVDPTPDPDPVDPQPTEGNLEVSFTDGTLGDFTVENKVESAFKGWYAKTGFPQCAIANSYVDGTNVAAESWLISPAVKLGENATLSIDHAFGFYFPTEQENFCTVLVQADGGDWTALTLTNYPPKKEGKNWTDFVNNTFDLSAYNGKTVKVAFRYLNDGNQSVAWELQNFALKSEGGEVVDPTPDPQPTGEKYTLVTTMAAGDYTIAFGTKVATTIDEGKTYGYLPVVDGTLDGTTLTTAAPVYTFEAAEGGYYIKDALGRYLIQTGNYNSFNLSETATSEGIFTVSLAADGTATIVNTNVNKTMGYSEPYNSVGSYPTTDGYVMPKLYAKSQTGITDITADENAPVEYYNLQGIRVANPENGIYVRRQGNSVSKVYVK